MKDSINNKDLIISFFITPFAIGFSIRIFIQGKFYHSAYTLDYIQARIFAAIIFVISSYILYLVLYKIPLQNHGIGYVKIIFDKLLHSSFLYIFIITITMPIILKFILSGYLWLIAVIILLLICFIAQWYFMKEIKKYIE
jgi:hypothetical protein